MLVQMGGIKQLREQADPYKTSLDLLKSIIQKTTKLRLSKEGFKGYVLSKGTRRCLALGHDVEHKSIPGTQMTPVLIGKGLVLEG